MEPADFLDQLRADGDALVALGAAADLEAKVPSCPKWTVAELFGHVGRVHRFWTEVLRTGKYPGEDDTARTPPLADQVVAWYREGLDALVEALQAVDPDQPTWNWSIGPQVAGFVHRRMAQETAVHRWDGENVVGAALPIDAFMAADGIDEFLALHVGSDAREPDAPVEAVTGTLHVHCTDVHGEWLARLDDRQVVLDRVHAKGDVAVRGGASDLLLVLWGRLPTSAVEVLGDTALLDAWRAVADI